MKKRGTTSSGSGGSFDDAVSRSEFLRAFGRLAVYAAPAALIATAGCGDDVGGGDGDDDCSVSSESIGSLGSVSCSSDSDSESEECVPGTIGCDRVAT